MGVSQSIHNAHGLGLINFSQNAPSFGVSSRGLVSAFSEQISLSNPVTWNNLKFAYLSGNYNGYETTSDLGKNGISGISNAQFTVPFGNQYAWGFGIRPLFNQKYLLEGDSEEFILESDTLQTQRFMDGSGGLVSLYTAFRFPISEKEGIALEFDVLFGSHRKNMKFNIDDREFYYFQRHIYDGSLWKIFFTSNRFKMWQKPVNIHLLYSGSINPLRIKQLSFQPFEDINNNGFYDSADKPSPTSVPDAVVSIFNGVMDPVELGFGIEADLNNNLHLLLEAHQWEDKSDTNEELFPLLSLYINKSQQFSLGVAKFSPEPALKLLQKFQYRGGVYFRRDQLAGNELFVNESGFSLGIGIKFGAMNNQIDVSFRRGIRSSDFTDSEIINEFLISFQFGDRWFVKRRPK